MPTEILLEHKEILPTVPSFYDQIKSLCDHESPIPLDVNRVRASRPEARKLFIESGIDLEIIENNIDLIKSLQNDQVRDLSSGMGPALAAALDGQFAITDSQILNNLELTPDSTLRGLKVMVFRGIAQDLSENIPALDGQPRYTKRRPCEKFLGYCLSFLITVPGTDQGTITAKEFCKTINWMVGANIERPLEDKTIKAKKLKDKTDSESDTKKWEDLKSQLAAVRLSFGIPNQSKPEDRVNYSGYSRLPDHIALNLFENILTLGQTPRSELSSKFPQVSADYITRPDLLGNDYK